MEEKKSPNHGMHRIGHKAGLPVMPASASDNGANRKDRKKSGVGGCLADE